MCSCRKVEHWEVAYRSVGRDMNLYHKVCGLDLSEAQRLKYEEQEKRRWETERRRESSLVQRTLPSPRSLEGRAAYVARCQTCGAVMMNAMVYCPRCGEPYPQSLALT
jgi:hypothetical protein